MDSQHALRISIASADTQTDALRLVFRQLSDEDRAAQVAQLLSQTAPDQAAEPLVLEARRGGQLVGALLVQIHPGSTAAVWPGKVDQGEPTSTIGELLSAATDMLAARGVRIAQALLEGGSEADEEQFRQAGFRHTADLLYLVSPAAAFPDSPPAGNLEFEPYDPANHGRLARIVEATYEGTLDCPSLDGVRAIEDVLAGYRATGAFDPQRWLIARHSGHDIGCLLLTDHPEADQWELVYMGLTPESRGRGWGIGMVRHAQWLSRQAGRSRLVLAVDAANAPALTGYAEAGFSAWDRRSVYLRVF
jgi:mycothiol synthase